MLSILLITFPFFALVLCGYAATRLGWLPLPAITGLNTYVLFFALPCMLFRFGTNTPFEESLNPIVLGIWLLCALLMVGYTILTTLSTRIGWTDASFGALVAAFPNTGYMGVPLLVALLGAQAAGPIIATILVDLIITTSLCIALSQLGHAGAHGARVAAAKALRGVLTNPLPWAILLGAGLSAVQLRLPAPVAQTIGLLADSASPAALFTIGAVLARSQMQSTDPTPLVEYVPVALKKLLLHPLLVLFVGAVAVHLGLPLDQFTLTAIVLVAALPSASNVAMLAERFGADNGRIARIILVSTTLAFLTFSGAVALLT